MQNPANTMSSTNDYNALTLKCCSLFLQNPVQLTGLRNHCNLFMPGKIWLISGQYDIMQSAFDKLERRFKRGPATHRAVRKFFSQAQVKICTMPPDCQFIRQHTHIGSEYAQMNKETDFIILIAYGMIDTKKANFVTASVVSVETTDAFLIESSDADSRVDWSLIYNVSVDLLLPEFSLAHANDMTTPTHDDMIRATEIICTREKTCNFCQNPAKYTCTGCGVARYCSAACQHENWTAHKMVCNYYFFLTDIVSKIANGCPVPNVKLEPC